MFLKRLSCFWLWVVGVSLAVSAQTVQVITSEGSIISSDGSEITPESLNVIRSFAYNGGTIVVDGHGNFEGIGVDAPFENVDLNRPVMRDFVLVPDVSGGYFIDFFGGVHPVGDAENLGSSYFGSPFNPLPAAADLELAFNNSGEVIGYYTLRNDGAVVSIGAVQQLTGIRTQNAVSIAISPNGDGYAIINARGQLAAFGNAPSLDISIDLGVGVTVVDFSFTGTGNGYYILDSSGIIHTSGDAVPVDIPTITGRAIGLETGVTAGSVENLPEDTGPIPTATNTARPQPTATNTQTPRPAATNTPTRIVEPTSTNTPILSVPTSTFTPVPPTNTQAPSETGPNEPTLFPTMTPTVTSIPTNTPLSESPPDPPFTPAPGESPTSTPTPVPAAASPTPTVTPVPPTPTPESPVEQIVPPGISSLLLGTWAGTAKTSTETRNARITISVQNNRVVVRDELGTVLGSVSNINMAVVSPLNITHQEPPTSTILRSFTLSNAKDLGEPNFISGLYGEIDISNPFSPVQRVSIALELFRQ